MIKIDINNKQDLIEPEKWLNDLMESIVELIAKIEGYEEGQVSVVLVDNKFIQKLNKKYRNLDEPTDVLSFPLDDYIWGDVIISVERAQKQAEEYGHSLEREIGYLFTHGVLHLVGYEHKTNESKRKMRDKEKQVMNKLNITR